MTTKVHKSFRIITLRVNGFTLRTVLFHLRLNFPAYSKTFSNSLHHRQLHALFLLINITTAFPTSNFHLNCNNNIVCKKKTKEVFLLFSC